MIDLYDQYRETAMWTDFDPDEDGRDPAEFDNDDRHGREIVEPMLDLCAALVERHERIYHDGTIWSTDTSQIAHDLYLTRCGHGTGFWDRHEYPDATAPAARLGRQLSAIARNVEVV